MSWTWKHTVLLLLLALTGCEDPSDQPSRSQFVDTIVVEAVLTNENIRHVVKLSRPSREIDVEGQPVSGALVQITEGATTVTLTEIPAGSGLYYTPVARAVFGKTYTLRIVVNGREYFAQDSSKPIDALPLLRYEKVTTTDSYYRLLDPDDGNAPNYISHAISWKQTAFCTSADASCEAFLVFYDLKNLDVNAQFKPGKTDFMFPSGSKIIRRKYSVSDSYKAFLRSMLSETEWRGGVFDVERGNATTNLSNGAIGFFAVTTVVADTTVVQ